MESALEAARKTAELIRNMPTRTRWHALISVCVAFVFYAIIVYPASVKLEKLKKESQVLQEQIKLQAKFLPLYARLKTGSELSVLDGLPQTLEKPMSKNEVQDLCANLATAAQKSGILLVSARPQPDLKSGVVNYMPVDMVAKGHFSDFKGFLLGASALQGFDSISHLEITREVDREKLEARMWIVVE